MINKNIIKQPKSIVEVTITAPWTDLQATWDATLQRMAADVELSGFRKGQAPLPMVEQQLGTRLQDEVLKAAMPNFLIEALKSTDIIPIDYPKYDLISFAKGNQVQFKATITNRPAVNVGNYKAVKVARPTPKAVAEEEVQKVVDDLFKRWKARAGAQPAGNASQQTGGQVGSTPIQSGSINFQGGQSQAPTSVNGQIEVPNDEFAKAMGALSLSDLKSKIKKDLESNVSYNNEMDF